MKNLTDEDIKEMFDLGDNEDNNQDILNPFTNTPFPPDEEGENMISFSMFLPPEALLSLVEAGLLNIEDVQKMIDIMGNPPGFFERNDGRDGKYTGDNEDRKSADDGMDWEDWSPDPDDYL